MMMSAGVSIDYVEQLSESLSSYINTCPALQPRQSPQLSQLSQLASVRGKPGKLHQRGLGSDTAIMLQQTRISDLVVLTTQNISLLIDTCGYDRLRCINKLCFKC